MPLNTVTLTWDLTDLVQEGQAGTLTIRPTAQITGPLAGITAANVPVITEFTGGTGELTGIIALDNIGISPAPPYVAYQITVKAGGQILPGYPFTAFILSSDGATQDLSDLVHVAAPDAMRAFMPAPDGSPSARELPFAAGTGSVSAWDVLEASDIPALPYDTQGAAATAAAAVSAEAARAQAAEALALPLAGGTVTGPLSRSGDAVYHLDNFTGGNDDARAQAALAAIQALAPGGARLRLAAREHNFSRQWLTAYTAGAAFGLTVEGASAAFNGAWGSPSGSTVLSFSCTGVGACMDFQHLGSVELRGLQISSPNLGVPLVQTTNATPNIHDCVFSGGGSGTSCVTDAIVLGGPTTVVGTGDTAKYNAYQGRIYGNFFDGVRRCVKFSDATNAVIAEKNTISTSCGSNDPLGAPFELDASARGITNVYIQQNLVEISHYRAGIYAHGASPNGCTQCTFGPNGFYDSTPMTLCAVYLDTISSSNVITDGYHDATYPFVIDCKGNSTVLTGSPNFPSVYPNRYAFTQPGLAAPAITAQGHSTAFPGVVSVENSGHGVGLLPVAPAVTGYPQAYIWAAPGTIVTDGQTFTGGYWVTSAAAAFALTDQGYVIGGSGIATRSVIQGTFTSSTAPYWLTGQAAAAGDIVRPQTANGHLYQAQAAGTAAATQPIWPTDGSAVTDGTVTWLDLGPGLTAARLSAACTSSGTGTAITFGRPGTSVQQTGFSAHHIISSGSAPALGSVGAGAGSGAACTVTGNDFCHQVTLTTGTSPATGTLATISFSLSFGTTPKGIQLTAASAAAAPAMASVYVTGVTAAHYSLAAATALPASTALAFNVTAVQ